MFRDEIGISFTKYVIYGFKLLHKRNLSVMYSKTERNVSYTIEKWIIQIQRLYNYGLGTPLLYNNFYDILTSVFTWSFLCLQQMLIFETVGKGFLVFVG